MYYTSMIFAVLLLSCNTQVGPFVPKNPTYCSSNTDCKDNEHCGFPTIDSKPVCMDGPSGIDDFPEPVMIDKKRK